MHSLVLVHYFHNSFSQSPKRKVTNKRSALDSVLEYVLDNT